MTGFGEARRQSGAVAVAIELRTVNNRYFKFSLRASEGYSSLEPQIEALVRQHVRRGTVQLNLRIDREPGPDDYRLNEPVLSGYLRQLEAVLGAAIARDGAQLAPLLALPGVVREPTDDRIGMKLDIDDEATRSRLPKQRHRTTPVT